nr:MAG TPA: hypothetical protein [Caudoviricetes sp.]
MLSQQQLLQKVKKQMQNSLVVLTGNIAKR